MSTSGPSATLKIFLSYRRDDTSGHAGRLFDELTERGHYDIFMDIERIDAGIAYRQSIDSALAACDVFLALIGRGWLNAQDSSGRQRLENPEDLVRLEVERALARDDVRVVPVLVQEAEMPSSEALPVPLRPLTERNAQELSDTRWHYDVGLLIEALDEIVAEKQTHSGSAGDAATEDERKRRREGLSRRAKIIAGAAAAAVLVLGIVGLVALLGGGEGPDEATDAGPTTTVQTGTEPTTSEATTTTETEPAAGNPEESVGVPFPYDPASGTSAVLPVRLTFEQGDRREGTIPSRAGFTGLMTDGKTPLEGLYDPGAVRLANGVLRIRAAKGDPLRQPTKERPPQRNAFQFGVGSPEEPFIAHVRLPEPFGDESAVQALQSLGLFLGTGDQDNYVKLVVGGQGVELRAEADGKPLFGEVKRLSPLPGPDAVDLFLAVDPAEGTVTASFTTSEGGDTSDPVRFGSRFIPVLGSWLDNPDSGLAVGVISTTGRNGRPFAARWDVIEVAPAGAR